MKKKSLDEHDIKIASLNSYYNGKSNHEERMLMKKFISTAMQIELTEKQKFCVTEYYINDRTLADIAGELGVCVTTVSFHIKRGIEKIKKRVKYMKM